MRVALHSVVLLPLLLLPIAVTEAQTCSNGLDGYDHKGEVCCPLSCGACGGSGCSKLPGGRSSCCVSGVKDNQPPCSQTFAAPCEIDGDLEEAATGDLTPAPVAPSPFSPVPAPLTLSIPAPSVLAPTTPTPIGGTDDFTDDGMDDDLTPAPVSPDPVSPVPAPPTNPIPAPTILAPAPVTPTPITPAALTPSFDDDASPTPVMTIPTSCDSDTLPTFRYAASSGKVEQGRLYAETEGCFTMTDIYNWRGTVSSNNTVSSKGPIYQLDGSGNVVDNPGPIGSPVTGKWLLTAELYMTNGAIFYCKGCSAGGDCDELRIQSNGPDDWYEVRGHGGSLYFEDTVVTSWDTIAKEPQATYEGGRSFLNCVSEYLTGETCEGAAKNDRGECRMDIINSEMGYMGWFDSESYGLTWKVRGFCKDLSNHDVFEETNVYGDIIGSDIHHMYYGHYSYGHQGGVWTDNKMHDNWQYGFDPHDDSDYLTIARNEVYNNVNHGIIASKRCNNVQIYDNEVRDGGEFAAGIFLHRSSDNAEVYGNTITNMQDAGIAMLESMNAHIHDNVIDGVRYGIRMSLGSAGNLVEKNIFNDCSDYGLFTYQGSDPPTEGVSDGRPNSNTFDSNDVTNTEGAVKLKYSDNMIVTNNKFDGATQIEFFDAQTTQWSNNEIPDSGICVKAVSRDKGEDIPTSTFLVSDGLPSEEC